MGAVGDHIRGDVGGQVAQELLHHPNVFAVEIAGVPGCGGRRITAGSGSPVNVDRGASCSASRRRRRTSAG